MILKKLDINKRELMVLAIVSLIVIAALVVFISIMAPKMAQSPTDLEFLGYQFSVGNTDVVLETPYDGEFAIEINDETLHELEALSENINDAYARLFESIRNALIFVYLVFLIILLWKKRKTYFQGIVMGFLIGASLLLILFILKGIFDVKSLLLSFEHHITHMLFPG
ncbi:MAG: hypothetical protein R3232_09460 [Clostridia bacterium]|nr:hypothetical protein [Clostridia bacterium]